RFRAAPGGSEVRRPVHQSREAARCVPADHSCRRVNGSGHCGQGGCIRQGKGLFVDDRMGCHSTPLSLLQLDVSRSWSRSIADSIDDRRSLADVRLTDDVFVTRVDVVEIEGACGDE
ncbi:MAG: oxidoreductase, partial [Rhodococcus erythropolis]|nr:oxidoreductase [Rhodococcus erythropolis]